ncbi:MAG: rhamnan synthesis F family protein [Lachnospiraceae bacterium]|nr:rhamnan synthesis F family protein [Lachnospiraceae bacterium]
MKLDKEHIRRCGIFLFFDKDGIVDDYIVFMLEEMKKQMEYLLVVCNGFVATEGREKLANVANDVLYRVNLGLDVGGYRDGLFYLGFKELEKYDELVLFNYTFIGPLSTFENMFKEMDKKDVDFWGITKHHMMDKNQNPVVGIRYGYMPEHLQSHFFALRSSLFLSYQYKDFMINMINPKNYNESICGYEVIFTKYFADLGFSWDVYCNTDIYREYVFNPMMFRAKEMIRDLNCPIIKRRAFFTDYIDVLLNTCGETSIEAFEYIRNNTEYKEELIWDNILRLENLRDVHRLMHFNYILPKNVSLNQKRDAQYAIWIFLDSLENLLWYMDYLDEIKGTEIFVVGTETIIENAKKCIQNENVTFILSSGETLYFDLLLTAAKYVMKYEYICVLSMHSWNEETDFRFDLSTEYQAWENMIGSKMYIQNIVDTFAKNPRLGMIIPPSPIHGKWFETMNDGWMGYFDTVVETLNKWNISINVKKSSEPLFPMSGCFWIRTGLLKEFERIDRDNRLDRFTLLLLIPLLVQNQHYYTGIAYTEEYAAIETTNQDYMLRENNKAVFEKYGAGYFHEVINRIKNS